MDMARSMMAQAQLPKTFWGDCAALRSMDQACAPLGAS